jgi:Domain of unknown function (DUF5063)
MKTAPSPQLSEFAQLAAAFCTWCESGSLGEAPERAISQWFAQLYAGGLLLSEVEAEDDVPEDVNSDTAEGEAAIKPMHGYYYREVFDPHPMLNEEPGVGDIGDDLLDVYKDIKRGLKIYSLGFPLAAEWEWAFNFRVHWGRHAAAALLALHGLAHSSLAREHAA